MTRAIISKAFIHLLLGAMVQWCIVHFVILVVWQQTKSLMQMEGKWFHNLRIDDCITFKSSLKTLCPSSFLTYGNA